ncbi:hypothetical protein [Pseudonocardia sp. TRM90224]|uniref:hypothetical protein n=1 Tax=Pseudonocardia sp. TRM90224 TaxID=2812678 RepID=UPI001E2E2975|nr:hypothetical protein [Pseudonocardia sp. TRM90224]
MPNTAPPPTNNPTADATSDDLTRTGGNPCREGADGRRGRSDAIRDRLWAALRRNPGRTAAELATHAGIGASTASKILATWYADGSAVSTPGDTPRAARTWTAAPSTLPSLPDGSAMSSRGTMPVATTTVDPSDQHAALAAGSDQGDDATIGRPGCVPAQLDDSGADTNAGTGHDTSAEPTRVPRRSVTASFGATASSTTATARRSNPNRSGSVRLQAGELRGMIEDYLLDHPGEYSPVDIGNKLRRSPGAIANALERLVDTGTVDRTSDKPRRYRHTEAEAPGAIDTDVDDADADIDRERS